MLLILKNDPHVLGLVFAGSYARGDHDAFSDLDVTCYLRDEERTGRQQLHERVAEIAPTLSHLWVYDLHALYLFENGVRLDLDLCRPSDISHQSEVYANAVIEYDPDGVLQKSIVKSSMPQAAEHPKWFGPGDVAMLDWYFWMFRQVVCWAKRAADRWDAQRCLALFGLPAGSARTASSCPTHAADGSAALAVVLHHTAGGLSCQEG